LTRLWADRKKDMEELEKGAKPSEAILAAIETVAKSVAKGFEK